MNEDQYFPQDSIIKDDLYIALKDSITCAICSNILREPIMCMKCQKAFCKNCIYNYPNNKEKCPNNCKNPNYKNDITKLQILSKIKYECKNCGDIVSYEDIQSHLKTNCKTKIAININHQNDEYPTENEEIKLKKLKPEETSFLTEKSNNIEYLKSKKIYF